MYHLETVFPLVRRLRRIPVTRDQAMLLLMAVNMLFLGLDTYLAHSTSGTIRPYEWIPIIYGSVSGILLLLAGILALRFRSTATLLGSLLFLGSIIVGLLGTYFHLNRALLPGHAPGQQISLIVWAPPALGPLAFALIGWMGLSAIWVESPADSGRLKLLGGRTLHLPYSKTQAYFFLVGIGVLMALISSTLDHARTGFLNPWLLVPLGFGVFGTVVPIVTGLIDRPSRGDLLTYTITMGLLMLVGAVGAYLHIWEDIAGVSSAALEYFLRNQPLQAPVFFTRGAPVLAPMLFANFGMLGLIALLNPREEAGAEVYEMP